MSNPPRPTRSGDTDRLAARVLEELARPVRGPELTGPVMARLGFMRAHPRVVRRRRVRRWIGRGLAVGVALGVIGTGLWMHQLDVEARRPQRLTIPAAISQDLDQYQRRLDRVVESLRSLVPTTSVPAPVPQTPADPPPQLEEPLAETQAGGLAQWT